MTIATARRAALASLLCFAPLACAPLTGALPGPADVAEHAHPQPAPVIAEDRAVIAPPPVEAVVPIAAPAEIAAAPIELSSAPAFEAAPRDRVRAVVLLYHLFGPIDSDMAVTTAAFEEQLDWLVDHRIPVIATSDLLSFLEGGRELPERAAVIQIDDGHVSTRTRAFPALERRGLRFTLAINTEAIEGQRREAMTWDAVREILASGLCEIASHSHIHGHMDRLTDASNQREVTLSRSILEARTGVRPEAFVYPFGGQDARVRQAVEDAGYRAAFGVGGIAARASSPRFLVPRVSVTRSTTMATFARTFGVTAAEANAPARPRAPAG